MKTKIDLNQDSFLMIQKIYVNKDRTNFIYISDHEDCLFNNPRVKMVTYQNRDLSDLLWETMYELLNISTEKGLKEEIFSIPNWIDILEDTGIEIIEE